MLHMSVITQSGNSALYWAAFKGYAEIIQQLVKAGANLDLQNKVCQYVETHDVHEYSEQRTESGLVCIVAMQQFCQGPLGDSETCSPIKIIK